MAARRRAARSSSRLSRSGRQAPPSRRVARSWGTTSFHALSLGDLLVARDAYHVHLTRLENVVATAIGRYRMTHDDPQAKSPDGHGKRGRERPRTLSNSVVRKWSWPCVLVFVEQWIPPKEFRNKYDEIVPPRLYLPDGLSVPTCVVQVEKAPLLPINPSEMRFPVSAIGGGYPVFADVQGTTSVSSLGCLVSDGNRLYALTNRHVTGDAGRELYTLLQGQRERVGVTAPRFLGRAPFEAVYPGLKSGRTQVNLDAGLVELDDATHWTSQTYGLGEFGPLYDLSVDTLSVDLIGTPVVAYGATSRRMVGEVQGLFYRYRSVGGMDFVADVLIGCRGAESGPLGRYGNSGAVWFVEEPTDVPDQPMLRPFALHWGAQAFAGGAEDEVSQFALGTFLSTICRELDVDIVRDHNTGLPVTWGKLGHYKVGAAACGVVTNKNLKSFFAKNVDRVSFSDDDLADLESALRRTAFTALADVPDIVWKERGPRKRGRESPNHFADMDQPSSTFGNKTLLQVCNAPNKVDPELWKRFYDSIGVGKTSRGLLPFRVWQLFDVMVDAVGQKNLVDYLCAAGILAHYVADACQPLHTSYLHDGDPDTGEGEGVHSAYQTKMVDAFSAEIIAGVNDALSSAKLQSIQSGRDAGWATVELMRRSVASLPPEKLIATYLAHSGKERIAALWDEHGQATLERMADGATALASMWQGAWILGGGSKIAKTKLVAVNKNSLRTRYENRAFAPSVYLHMLSLDGERLRVDGDD